MIEPKSTKVEHQITIQAGVTILAIKGRLDAVRVAAIQQPILDLPSQGHHRIVIDLSDLEWIDSSGVRVLVALYKQLHTLGGIVNVACLQRQPKEIFRLLRLESAFGIFETVNQAVTKTSQG